MKLCYIVLSPIYGLYGIAIAILVTAIGVFFSFSVLTRLELNISLVQIANIYLRPLIAAMIMFACVHFVIPNFSECCSPAFSLLALITVGASSYGISLYLLWLTCGMPDGPELKVWKFFATGFTVIRSR